MTTKQQTKRRFDFNARSMLIIATSALAMAGSGVVFAQTPPPPPSPTSPGAPMTSPGGGSPGGGGMSTPPAGGEKAAPSPGAGSMGAKPPSTRKEADAAFNRADANHDGKLTKNEAAALPWLSEHWNQVDKDHKGTVTKAQYEDAVLKAGKS